MIPFLVISIYLLLALIVAVGFLWHSHSHSEKAESLISVSIIIPARNEEKNIEACISSIVSQHFPKENIELILVDDASTDATSEKASALLKTSGFNYKMIRNERAIGKKESLKKAIGQSSNELIITRDADTFTKSNEWLNSIVNYYRQSKKEFIICPISTETNGSFLSTIQEIETAILSLFAVSSAFFKMPFLCSGANLAFTKKLFYETNAYQKHLHIASGDDVFFLEDVKKLNPSLIGYLKNKNAIVYTYPEKDLKSLLNQKIRWSGKVFKIAGTANLLTASIIAIANFTWLWMLFYSLFSPQNALNGLFFILPKLLIDFLLVFLAASFIKLRANLALVLLAGCFYPLYASLIVVLAPLIKPKWKSN